MQNDGQDYERFKNLAGYKFCDLYIEMELTLAGIPIHSIDRTRSEVPFSKVGLFEKGPFMFQRTWYYWVVNGPVPLDIAKDLYADPVGAKDVWVVGHCGCPPPEQWATSILSPDNNIAGATGELFIMSYHIDSLPGLKLFVEKIKQIV